MALVVLPRSHENGAAAKAIFTPVPRETVWKFGIVPNRGSESGQEGSKESRSATFCRQTSPVEKPSAIFQTVSEGEFSEVRLVGRARFTLPSPPAPKTSPVRKALARTSPTAPCPRATAPSAPRAPAIQG